MAYVLDKNDFVKLYKNILLRFPIDTILEIASFFYIKKIPINNIKILNSYYISIVFCIECISDNILILGQFINNDFFLFTTNILWTYIFRFISGIIS